MYQSKDKSYGFIAVAYYMIYCSGLFLAGILYQKGSQVGMNIIYCLLCILGALIVIIKDKSIHALGVSKENAYNFLGVLV